MQQRRLDNNDMIDQLERVFVRESQSAGGEGVELTFSRLEKCTRGGEQRPLPAYDSPDGSPETQKSALRVHFYSSEKNGKNIQLAAA